MMTDPTPDPEQSRPVPERKQLFGDCWSCRVLSGGGLIGAGGYVYLQARKIMRSGGPTSVGTIAQIVFATGLAAWGVVVLTDPVGKASRKEDPRWK